MLQSTNNLSAATASLCLVAITHTYLLFHCFPYVGYMTVSLLHHDRPHHHVDHHVTVDSVGIYAGLLGSAFTLGRCLSFVPWSLLRKQHLLHMGGIKPTLLLSLAMSAVCSLAFGMAPTYGQACLTRFLLGLSNTLSGSVKRAAMDQERLNTRLMSPQTPHHHQSPRHPNQNHHPPHQEELTQARVLAVMWWGTAIGPCLGGWLSNVEFVAKDDHNDAYFDEDLPDWMHTYPFLLPNIVAAILCSLSMIGIALFVKEEGETATAKTTAPKSTTPTYGNNMNDDTDGFKPVVKTHSNFLGGENHPLLQSDRDNQQPLDEDSKKEVSISTATTIGRSRIKALKYVWKRKNTRYHLMAYWAFSFVVVCIDEALPLFLIARWYGPGLSTAKIGLILSASGLIVALSQSKSLTLVGGRIFSQDGLGFYSSLKLAAIMGSLPSLLIPLVLILNGGTYYTTTMTTTITGSEQGDMNHERLLSNIDADDETQIGSFLPMGPPGDFTLGSFFFVVLVTSCLRGFHALYFALIGVATSRTVPPSHREDVGRIMTLGALCFRAMAPTVAGGLATVFLSSSSPWTSTTARSSELPFSGAPSAMVMWCIIGVLFCVMAAAWTFRLKEAADVDGHASERSQRHSLYLDIRQRSQVFTKLWEEYDHGGAKKVGDKWRGLVRIMGAPPIPPRHSFGAQSSDLEIEERQHRRKTSRHIRHTSWVDHVLRPGLDPDTVPFFILGTHKHDTACLPHVLTPPLMEALHKHLPMSCADTNFLLKYSLLRDGASTTALETRICMSKYTFLAIETLDGDVFGCFMTKPWEKTNKYEMSGESFLWRMKKRRTCTNAPIPKSPSAIELNETGRREGEIEVFRWTGLNDLCMLFGDDKIAAGGGMIAGGSRGFGFIVEDGLLRGFTGPCETYENPCLLAKPAEFASSNDGRFEVANMEVWAMTPFLFAAEAEESENNLRFLHQNTKHSAWGDDTGSRTQSAWSNFI